MVWEKNGQQMSGFHLFSLLDWENRYTLSKIEMSKTEYYEVTSSGYFPAISVFWSKEMEAVIIPEKKGPME